MSIDSPKEEWIANDISFKQTNRLLAETIDPFQFRFSHPQWGAWDTTRREIKQSTDADADAAIKFVQMVVDPKFLFRYAKSNQKNIRIGSVDVRNDLFFMALEKSMMCSDNPQARMLF